MPEEISLLGKLQDAGCSPFFMTSSLISLINGKRNRALTLENAKNDIEFKKDLAMYKAQCQDEKEAEDRAFKKWLRKKVREYSRSEALVKLDNELNKQDLQMFFTDWPLTLDVQAIPNLIKQGVNKPYFIVARHDKPSTADPLHTKYKEIISETAGFLNRVGVQNEKVLSFNSSSKKMGGPAVANIFAMMHTIPTVMVLPSVNPDGEHIDFSVGAWNQDSAFPLNRKLFSIDYDKNRMLNDKDYFDCKVKEIKFSTIAVAGVLNDVYNLIEFGTKPRFPELAHQIGITDYPVLMGFAKREYLSIANPMEITAGNTGQKLVAGAELFDEGGRSKFTKMIKETVESLSTL